MSGLILLTVLIFAVAVLYSSVGQAGATGYLAAMALVGVAPDVMKPTALALNVLVASLSSVQYYRAGYFRWSAVWPFVVSSVPLAFVGGAITLPAYVYETLVGVILLYTAYRLVRATGKDAVDGVRVPLVPALLAGGVIGLLSGLTGIGGGIFLAPLLLMAGWADTRSAAATSVTFILVTSLAGLAGNVASVQNLPSFIPVLAVAALVGGFIGTQVGTRRLAGRGIYYLLATVLVVAGVTLLLT